MPDLLTNGLPYKSGGGALSLWGSSLDIFQLENLLCEKPTPFCRAKWTEALSLTRVVMESLPACCPLPSDCWNNLQLVLCRQMRYLIEKSLSAEIYTVASDFHILFTAVTDPFTVDTKTPWKLSFSGVNSKFSSGLKIKYVVELLTKCVLLRYFSQHC